MMKVTLLLLIVCITEIYANDRDIFRECFRDYGEDYDALSQHPEMTMEEVISQITPYKLGCISVCYLKTQLMGTKSIRKHINDTLNEVHPRFTDAEIATYKDEVKRCTEEANTDDCKLIECLKPWSPTTRITKIIGL